MWSPPDVEPALGRAILEYVGNNLEEAPPLDAMLPAYSLDDLVAARLRSPSDSEPE